MFSVPAQHIYAGEGDYALAATIKDAGGATATATSTMHVADAALSATGVALSVAPSTATLATVATFNNTNPAVEVTDYSATIDWGDGGTSPGSIVTTQGGYQVRGSHTYATTGDFTVKTIIADRETNEDVIAGFTGSPEYYREHS